MLGSNSDFLGTLLSDLNQMTGFMKNFLKKCLPEKIVFFRESFNDFPYRKYMNKNKCIFIHIPKAAGTSVLNVLSKKKVPRDHCSYNIFLQSSKKKFHSYFKFCFVRNPYTRLMSVYYYLKNGGNGKSDLEIQELIKQKYSTFEKFVLDYLDKDLIYQISLLRPQYTYICNYKYEVMVDFCGKFENIEKDFSTVCEILRIKKTLPTLNKTNYKDNICKIQSIQKEVIGKINSLYQKDFEVFGYEFR